jgi:Glycosyltransferase family 87
MYSYLLYAILVALWIALIRSERTSITPPAPWRRSALPVKLVALAIVTAAAMLAITRGRALHDFDKAYYPAGIAILHDPASLYVCPDEAQCFVNVPIVAAAFIPLSILPLTLAHALIAILSLFSVAALIVAISRLTGSGPRISTTVAAIVLLNGPLYYSVRLGNTTHIIALAIVVAMLLDRRERSIGAGVLIGLAALMKPTLLVFAPYFALRKRGHALSGLAVTLAAAMLMSVGLFGFEAHREWLHQVVIASGSGPIAAYNSQSVGAALARLLLDKGFLWTWTPMAADSTFKAIQTAVFFALVGAVVLACSRTRQPGAPATKSAEWFLVLCVALAVGPVTWTHYYVLLVPALAWLAIVEPPSSRSGRVVTIAAALLVSAPVVLAIPTKPDVLAALYERLLVSHYVAGLFLLIAVIGAGQWRRRRPVERKARLAATA